jgi:SNF2 family DNA or RNA helicase
MPSLYDYQKEYLKGMPKNVIMAADVGLGKTIMALEHARRHRAKKLVVIAPASKVRTGDWQREIERFFSNVFEDGTVVSYNSPRSLEPEVISYEMFTKKWKELVNEHTTLIIDESHFICNATALRSKAILAAAKIAHQWIMLSATPLPNGWRSAETYAILTGLAKNKTKFVERFEIYDRSRGFPLLLGYRETETLKKWWEQLAKPLARTGDQHLPSQNIGIEEAMPAKLAKVYRTAVKERLYNDEPLDSSSKLFMTLRQIPNAVRVDALQSIVESTDEHIVVFYNFNSEREAMLELLAKSFKERKIYEQSGHKSELPPREKWGSLKPSVTLVQYQSGSQAIELTYASVTVYLSPCTSYANYEQSKGRTRRNGQDKTTLFYHIAAEGSVDRHIWQILKSKRDFSLQMFENTLDM